MTRAPRRHVPRRSVHRTADDVVSCCGASRGRRGSGRFWCNGSVEAVFEGALDDVERLVDVARLGPRGARVDRLEVWEEPVEGVSGFRIVG